MQENTEEKDILRNIIISYINKHYPHFKDAAKLKEKTFFKVENLEKRRTFIDRTKRHVIDKRGVNRTKLIGTIDTNSNNTSITQSTNSSQVFLSNQTFTKTMANNRYTVLSVNSTNNSETNHGDGGLQSANRNGTGNSYFTQPSSVKQEISNTTVTSSPVANVSFTSWSSSVTPLSYSTTTTLPDLINTTSTEQPETTTNINNDQLKKTIYSRILLKNRYVLIRHREDGLSRM